MRVRTVGKSLLFLILFVLGYHTLVRIVRHVYKFPVPEFLADLIDNPLRRRMQPPDATALRHGIEPGMTVLDVGPGNGRYSAAAARQLGPRGRLYVLDIEPKMVERTLRRARAQGLQNVVGQVASAHHLPFPRGTFDLIYTITVMGEIPDPSLAMMEFRWVLKPGGKLACSELLVDPDYPLAQTLVRWAESAGLHLQQRHGNFFYYTLIFEKTPDDDTR